MTPLAFDKILNFRKICMDAGVHTLSFLAVLAKVETGDSCRKVALALGIPYSTVWRSAVAMEQQGLLELTEVPHRGGCGKRFLLSLSDKGRRLASDLDAILLPPILQARRL